MENLYEISSSSTRQRMKQCGRVWTGVSRCLGTETRKTDRNMSTETAGEAVTLTGIREEETITTRREALC